MTPDSRTPNGFMDRVGTDKLRLGAFCLLLLTAICGRGAAATEATTLVDKLIIHFNAAGETNSTEPLRLIGHDAHQQLLATARLNSGALRDFTRQVSYEVSPTDVVRLSQTGLVTPVANGQATITVKLTGGFSASLPVMVEKFGTTTTVNFPNQIVPIFTKTGCNGGGC